MQNLLHTFGIITVFQTGISVADISLSDSFTTSEFASSDYTVYTLQGTPSYTISSVNDELRVAMSSSMSGNRIAIFPRHFIVDPGILGALQSISVSCEAGVLNGRSSVRLALRQGGKLFDFGRAETSNNYQLSYVFTSEDGLDLSSSGSPIFIGITTHASFATFTVNYRFDDLEAVAVAGPETVFATPLPGHEHNPIKGRQSIENLQITPAGTCKFTFSTGGVGSMCVVGCSENMKDWYPLIHFNTEEEGTEIEDLMRDPRKFYNATYLPHGVMAADRFDYPFGDKGNNPNGTPKVEGVPEQFSAGNNTVDTDGDPETNDLYPNNPGDNPLRESYASGWRNGQDVGAYFDQADGIHPGEDWNYSSDDVGLPVYAVANGVLKDIAQVNNTSLGGAGYAIVIRHTLLNGKEVDSVYVHIAPATKLNGSTNERQSEIVTNGILEAGAEGEFAYQEGDAVRRGDKIGVIGDIDSEFDHLHFEMRDKPIVGLPSTSNAIDVYWPSDNGNVYYGTETTETTMLEDSVRAAYELMRADGIVDPSDFIDEHR